MGVGSASSKFDNDSESCQLTLLEEKVKDITAY